MKQIHRIRRALSAMPQRMPSRRRLGFNCGQAAVEFALVATVAMIVLFVAVQLALIGEDALALGQMNYQGARWAAVNPCATHAQVAQYMLSVGSPSVTKSGGTCGARLQFTIIDDQGSDTVAGSDCSAPTATLCSAPGATTRIFGNTVKITVTFDAQDAIFLGNGTKWMGLIDIPTQLTSTETAMAE
jgi:Flp pilus assembly protein TadG